MPAASATNAPRRFLGQGNSVRRPVHSLGFQLYCEETGVMNSLQDASGWSRVALGLQTWQRVLQRGKRTDETTFTWGDDAWSLFSPAARMQEVRASALAPLP